MKPDQINIAIAESLGVPVTFYTNTRYDCSCGAFRSRIGITIDTEDLRRMAASSCPYCKSPWPVDSYPEFPNYHGSLDAMAAAEEIFHSKHQLADKYAKKLEDIVYRTKHSGTDIAFQLLNASAPQRAEAYLKTLSLWIE